MVDINKLLSAAAAELDAGRPFMAVSVIASSGSTPRGAGAMMAVFSHGGICGTIGGGSVEHAARERAGQLLINKGSELRGYVLSKNDVADLGMICGGDVKVYFQYVSPTDAKLSGVFRYLLEATKRDESAWLIRRFADGVMTDAGVYDGSGLHFADTISAQELKPLLRSSAVLTDTLCSEPVVHAGKVYIFGGGHVAQELVPALARVNFRCVIFEDRAQFANPALFQGVYSTVLGDFKNISDKVSIGRSDCVVIMTRGHQSDFNLLAQVIRTDAYYLGCIGSRGKIAEIKRRLAAEHGYEENEFDRVHMPIGLSIKAETPAEIAVSVAAEMILSRAENG